MTPPPVINSEYPLPPEFWPSLNFLKSQEDHAESDAYEPARANSTILWYCVEKCGSLFFF